MNHCWCVSVVSMAQNVCVCPNECVDSLRGGFPLIQTTVSSGTAGDKDVISPNLVNFKVSPDQKVRFRGSFVQDLKHSIYVLSVKDVMEKPECCL